MQNENTIRITSVSHHVDYAAASESISCLPGRLVIEMVEQGKELSGLVLPDNVASDYQSDVGVVLTSGRDIPLDPGDLVIVRPFDGTVRQEFQHGVYKAQPRGQVRCYGVYVASEQWGEASLTDYWDSVVGQLDENMNINPLGKMILIRREAVVEKDGNIFLTDRSSYRPNIATIVQAGPDCEITEGRIVYHPFGCVDLQNDLNNDPDLALIREDAIEMILL